MGTSSHNPGQNGHTPLVPSWVDGDDGNISAPIMPNGDSQRLSAAKGNMTRFAENGNAHNFKNSVSQYVRHSTGGVRGAVNRLGSAKASTAKLVGIVGAYSEGGAGAVQDYLKTYNLIGVRADEALRSITDLICDDGGPTNEGIVRDAYIDTLADLKELRSVNFEDLHPDQIMLFLEGCMARIVVGRLLNDIGNKTLSVPDSLQKAGNVKKRMTNLVKGLIRDIFTDMNLTPDRIQKDKAQSISVSVYEKVYRSFAAAGE